ncbi:MAG: GAF domain-containing protein, partial [Deltaproteobacteria bacterium]|nr:GAF domain-containing protein [Deltaproteobacteria bacterium]
MSEFAHDKFDLLKRVIDITSSTIKLDRRLERIVQLLAKKLSVDSVLLFTLDPVSKRLVLKASSNSRLPAPAGVSGDQRLDILDRVATTRKPISIQLNGKRHLAGHQFFEGYNTLAAVPVADDSFLYGVLCLLSTSFTEFDSDIFQLLMPICRATAGTVGASRLKREAENSITELSIISEIAKVMSSTLEPKDLAKKIVTIISRVIGAAGCQLDIRHKHSQNIVVRSKSGTVPPTFKVFDPAAAIPASDMICANQSSSPIPKELEAVPSDNEVFLTPMLYALLSFKSDYAGVILAAKGADPAQSPLLCFTRYDANILAMLANFVSPALENAINHRL